MSKKIAISIAILIFFLLLGIGLWIARKPKVERPIEVKPPLVPKARAEIAAYGWSKKENEAEAVKEAVSMVKAKLGKSPDFVFLFSSINYDEEALLKEIKELLPEAKIYGGTSCLGPMTNDGFLGNEKFSLAILGISSNEIKWGVGGADLEKFSPKEAGKIAVSEAIKNAGKEVTEKPKIVFMTAAPGKEEEIIEGIEEVVGKNVPIFGGSSGDNEIKGEWRQFANERVYKNGLALAVAYTDLKVAYFYEAGYPVTAKGGTVTKAEGRVIYEIDGRPAAEVYNEWTGGAFSKQLKEPGKVWGILSESTFYPIAKVLRAPGKEPFYLAVHPLDIRPDH
jgi:hypothetical protein